MEDTDIVKRLEELLHRVKVIGLRYFENPCPCEWCTLKRSHIRPENLKYLMDYAIEIEKYEICAEIQKEIQKREDGGLNLTNHIEKK